MDVQEPEWVAPFLAWLCARLARDDRDQAGGSSASLRQAKLWTTVAYDEDAPAIRSDAELRGAVEHLEYAVFRRYHNSLTRAERARLDNSIRNALFKAERYTAGLDGAERAEAEALCQSVRATANEGRERLERQQQQARRADLKLAQLVDLTPEGFEEFVAELFEAMGYEVERVGGSGDEGADLIVTRGRQRGVVQCKYSKGKAVVGSPELQKFLGTIHHTRCHKGFFVTTRSFSLAAERFVGDHPIELIDGTRLVELVHQALGPSARTEPELLGFGAGA